MLLPKQVRRQDSSFRTHGFTIAAAVLCVTCIGGTGYWWSRQNVLRAKVDDAMLTLQRSHEEADRTGAALVVHNEALRMIAALVEASKRDDQAGIDAAQYLQRLAAQATRK